MTYNSGGNDTKIDFVLVGKEKREYLRDVKVIPGELQHRLVLVDVEKRKLRKSGKKSNRVRWRVWKLKEKEVKEEFEQRVVELVDAKAVDLWSPIRMVFLRLAMNYAERRKGEENREIHGGGMSK